jgi:hypothetical protein
MSKLTVWYFSVLMLLLLTLVTWDAAGGAVAFLFYFLSMPASLLAAALSIKVN